MPCKRRSVINPLTVPRCKECANHADARCFGCQKPLCMRHNAALSGTVGIVSASCVRNKKPTRLACKPTSRLRDNPQPIDKGQPRYLSAFSVYQRVPLAGKGERIAMPTKVALPSNGVGTLHTLGYARPDAATRLEALMACEHTILHDVRRTRVWNLVHRARMLARALLRISRKGAPA
jgi:hypothetical protein